MHKASISEILSPGLSGSCKANCSLWNTRNAFCNALHACETSIPQSQFHLEPRTKSQTKTFPLCNLIPYKHCKSPKEIERKKKKNKTKKGH